MLFYKESYSENAGMDWLQDRGLISDNCVTPEDVAPCDVKAVMEKAGAMLLWTLPPWHNPHPFSPSAV